MTQLRKKTADVTKRGFDGSRDQTGKTGKEESTVRPFKVNSQLAAKKTVRPRKATFSHEIFASAAEYDQSVASVVARIQSGQVPPRQPDE